MKLTRSLLVSSLIFMIAGLGTNVFAEDDDAGMGYGPRAPMGRKGEGKGMNAIHEKLGLNDEQKTKVEKLNDEHFKKVGELRKELKAVSDELRTEIEKEKSDNSVIKKLSKKIKEAQGKMVDLRTDHILSLKGILSAEQFKKLNELQKDRGKRMRTAKGDKPKKGYRERPRYGSGPRSNKAK